MVLLERLNLSADFSIFENGVQKIDCYFGYLCLNDDVWIIWAPNIVLRHQIYVDLQACIKTLHLCESVKLWTINKTVWVFVCVVFMLRRVNLFSKVSKRVFFCNHCFNISGPLTAVSGVLIQQFGEGLVKIW